MRAVEQQRAWIVRSFERLLEQQERLHDARLAGAVSASQDGQRPYFDALLFVDGFEAGDSDTRDARDLLLLCFCLPCQKNFTYGFVLPAQVELR